MRLLFVDFGSWQYDIDTPNHAPLGGSHSALCYLMQQLHSYGHEIFLSNRRDHILLPSGVMHFPLTLLTDRLITALNPNVCILLNAGNLGQELRKILPPTTPLIFWTQHHIAEDAVDQFHHPEKQAMFDRIVVVSEWQRQQYISHFGVAPSTLHILRNAISPAFEQLFEENESILKHKLPQIRLAYTSTPFRGLDQLVQVYPEIYRNYPELHLDIYSSLQVYQFAPENDPYQPLYEQCQQLEGSTYHGSVPQAQLSQALKQVAILSYPNTFPETSCIAALEAMASGCLIVTSALGALPETTAGFADLVEFTTDWPTYRANYGKALRKAIERFRDPTAHSALEEHLRAQVNYIHKNYTWSIRAQEWIAFLESLLTPQVTLVPVSAWQRRLRYYLELGRYADAISLCETLADEFVTEPHWPAYQGAAYILQGQETEAQLLWSVYLSQVPELEQSRITTLWGEILADVASFEHHVPEIRFALTTYAYEFAATLANGLRLLQLSMQLGLEKSAIEELLSQLNEMLTTKTSSVSQEEILNLINTLLNQYATATGVPEFIMACHQIFNLGDALENLLFELLRDHPDTFAPLIGQQYLALAIKQWGLYEFLSRNFTKAKIADLALQCANQLFQFELTPLGHDVSYTSKLNVLSTFKYDLSYSENVSSLLKNWFNNIDSCYHFLVENIDKSQIDIGSLYYSISSYFHLSHLLDKPNLLKPIFNQRNLIFYQNAHHFLPIEKYYAKITNNKPNISTKNTSLLTNQKIRIGFIGTCFHRHPAGYQIRSFVRLCNRDIFELYIYHPWMRAYQKDDVNHWFRSVVNRYEELGTGSQEIAEKIYNDQIDILIDLDSCTSDITYQVLTLKPAPLQATWVGFDAIGLPTVDYFIVDPYILPDGAQAWYPETLWRLPDCYLSFDGYEVANKTGIRDQLGLSADTVIFLCAQRASKIQPEMLKLQFAIVEAVPNAVLIVKYHSSSSIFEEWCRSVAEAEGFDLDKLYFLTSNLPEIHRANLYDVDVVLDTYPYAGGAMSLEALWLEVPIVTKVGQQFVARHTYTFLKNVGVEEGIAFNDEEYVNWGIRFGTEPDLRQRVSWKLRQAKRHAPLWNPQRFSREMEQALTAMVNRYQTGELVVPPRHRVGE
ncbi:O-linked N-acetylglucosamine transferase family protein [Thermosynechococcus sp. FA-CM-4201]